MLREALRRLLWLLPTLFLATAPTFWALTRATEAGATSPTSRLPMFVNLEPEGVQEHVDRAVQGLTSSTASGEAERALVEIGGAALPHLLPRLDSLSPASRGRVAVALVPLARRMNVGDDANLSDPESAILFWNRFWEEHQIDFRPAAVRRAVRRFAERPSPIREMELRRLDTFALPELVDAMRPIASPPDVARVEHLSRVAARVTGRPWILPEGSSLTDARSIVEQWEAFFRESGSRYGTLTGATRVGAALLETRYGKWAASIVRRGLGRDDAGVSIEARFRERAPTTFGLVICAWILGYPLGLAFALVVPRARSLVVRRLSDLGVLLGASATAVGLAAGLSGLIGGLPGAAAVMILGTSTLVASRSRATWERMAERPFVRTALALGASPLRAAGLTVRAGLGPWVASALTDLPGLLTAAFVVERAFGLAGLGDVTVRALQTGNVTWLLGLSLAGTLSVGIGQIAADWVHRALDPRISARLRERDGVTT